MKQKNSHLDNHYKTIQGPYTWQFICQVRYNQFMPFLSLKINHADNSDLKETLWIFEQ